MKPFHADLQNGSPEIAILAKARSFIASTTEQCSLGNKSKEFMK